MIENKIQYLIDRQAIRDTLFQHCLAFDSGDLSLMDDAWAPDCRRDDGQDRGGVIVGLDALRSKLSRSLGKFSWTHHNLGESRIEIDGDTATGLTYVACWHETVEGERCWGTARYYDEFRREPDGRWLITLRRMVMTGAEGPIAEHGGNWLERRVPSEA